MGERPITPDLLLAYRLRWSGPGRPLVFLNGCRTTAVEPRQALEFVGAWLRTAQAGGVVGTDITVFEPLATRFAVACLGRFLSGTPLGEAVRLARLELLAEHNPLALAYVAFALPSLHVSRMASESASRPCPEVGVPDTFVPAPNPPMPDNAAILAAGRAIRVHLPALLDDEAAERVRARLDALLGRAAEDEERAAREIVALLTVRAATRLWLADRLGRQGAPEFASGYGPAPGGAMGGVGAAPELAGGDLESFDELDLDEPAAPPPPMTPAAAPPAPEPPGAPPPPSAGDGAEPADGTGTKRREAWPLLDAQDEVAPGTPFAVQAGLSPSRVEGVSGTGRMLVPAEPFVLDLEVVVHGFTVIGPARRSLPVTPQDPYPSVDFMLEAHDDPDLKRVREIGCTFVVGGTLCGYASRLVEVVPSTEEAHGIEQPPGAPAELGLDANAPDEAADLTIVITAGDDRAESKLLWRLYSPHLVPPADLDPVDIGSSPQDFAANIIDTGNLAANDPRASSITWSAPAFSSPTTCPARCAGRSPTSPPTSVTGSRRCSSPPPIRTSPGSSRSSIASSSSTIPTSRRSSERGRRSAAGR